MRLQKYLSAAGLCSRREAENWIIEGRVAVNGRTALLGESAKEGDCVTVDGRVVSLQSEHCYVLLNKPKGYVTTLCDDRGRPTVADLVADTGRRLFPVGRLDFDSEGLLLMTDDGEVANLLMHPSHEVNKTYRVDVWGENIQSAAERLRGPLSDGETNFAPAEVTVLQQKGKGGKQKARLAITIHEGKNREIRRMCALVGLEVRRLVRVQQGELRLGDLKTGSWRKLTMQEMQYLHELAGNSGV